MGEKAYNFEPRRGDIIIENNNNKKTFEPRRGGIIIEL